MVDLIDRLARFFFLAKRYSAVLHADHRITSGERAILFEIAGAGPQSVPAMANRRGLTRQALQKTVDMLTARHLVEKRTPAGDRRNRTIALTADGRKLVEDMRATEYREADRIAPDLPTDDMIRTVTFLDWLEPAMAQRLKDIQIQAAERRSTDV